MSRASAERLTIVNMQEQVSFQKLRERAITIAHALPDGYFHTRFRDRPYGLSVRRYNGGRSTKLFAESLDGRDVVSANLYRSATREHLLPCEMSEERVVAFLNGFRHAAPVRPESRPEPSKR